MRESSRGDRAALEGRGEGGGDAPEDGGEGAAADAAQEAVAAAVQQRLSLDQGGAVHGCRPIRMWGSVPGAHQELVSL